MPRYEYLTVPAPRKGEKAKGVKTPEARIAQAMQSLLNEKGAAGWEYLRADLIPMDERAGITSKVVNYHTLLVFRRQLDGPITLPEDSLPVEAEAPRAPRADRDTPPPSVPFPATPERGAGAAARTVSPDVADEIAEDRES